MKVTALQLQPPVHVTHRPDQVILIRLKTDHNRADANMHIRFRIGESGWCQSTAGIMNKETLSSRLLSPQCYQKGLCARAETSLRQAVLNTEGSEKNSYCNNREHKQSLPRIQWSKKKNMLTCFIYCSISGRNTCRSPMDGWLLPPRKH